MNENEMYISEEILKNLTPEELVDLDIELAELKNEIEETMEKCDDVLNA